MDRPGSATRALSNSSQSRSINSSNAHVRLGASPIGLPSSLQKPSGLPLPSLRHNRSFARLAQLFGIGASSTSTSNGAAGSGDHAISGSSADAGPSGGQNGKEGQEEEEVLEDEEDEGEDGDEEVEMDEETLLWDAQSALIAHQPALAFEHYTQAALPPFRSSAACLALGHLLTRGSSLSPLSPTSPIVGGETDRKGKGRAYSLASPPTSPTISTVSLEVTSTVSTTSGLPRIASRILNFFAPSEPEPERQQPERIYTDLVATGWAIPTDGKKAVRDVEVMGVAGGWYVLGLGWIVDGQHQVPLARAIVEFDQDEERFSRTSTITPQTIKEKLQEEKDQSFGVISFGSKRVKGTERKSIHTGSSGYVQEESSSSEGTVLKTPSGGEDELDPVTPLRDVETTIKLLYDILVPLTRLYRNGHIQASDPVYLPPIQPSQLPDCLRARGDLQKRRNVWHLGAAVARNVLDMPLMKRLSHVRTIEAHRRAVQVMAHYVLGMTQSPRQSARHFRIIITLQHSGFEYPDELINQASQRLEILHRSPDLQTREGSDYPFPMRPRGVQSMSTMDMVQPRSRVASERKRISSISGAGKHVRSDSILSIASSLGTPIKTSPSIASLTTLQDQPRDRRASLSGQAIGGTNALSSLRKVSEVIERQTLRSAEDREDRWPSLLSWTYGSSRPTSPTTPTTPTTATDTLLSPTSTTAQLAEPYSPARSTACESDASSPRAVPRKHLRGGSADKSARADELEVPLIRHIASTPTLGTLREKERSVRPGTGFTTPDTSPFVNDANARINLKVDPVLAAAELNSALTKRVQCSVCSAKGVNFPECRRCGLVFCSRPCRVDEAGAGNGKKHVCGAWESRKLLAPPEKDKRGKAVTGASVKVGSARAPAPMLAVSFKQGDKLELDSTPRLGGEVVTAC